MACTFPYTNAVAFKIPHYGSDLLPWKRRVYSNRPLPLQVLSIGIRVHVLFLVITEVYKHLLGHIHMHTDYSLYILSIY